MYIADILDTYLNKTNIILVIIIILIVKLILWIITREIKLWYWRLDELIDEQQKQTEILEALLKKMPDAEPKAVKKEQKPVK